MLEPRLAAGRGGSFTGRFEHMPHIAFWGMSPIAYSVAYAIRDVQVIAGTTQPSISTSNIEQNIN